jgi:hypothetical protein
MESSQMVQAVSASAVWQSVTYANCLLLDAEHGWDPCATLWD